MKCSKKTTNAIEPKGYVKPYIEMDGYMLSWNEASFGIARNEASELRTFIRDALPIIPRIVDSAKSMQKDGERERHLRRYELDSACSPKNILSHRVKYDAAYEIYVGWDGVLFIDRTEDVDVVDDDQSVVSHLIKLKWNLGELVRAEAPIR